MATRGYRTFEDDAARAWLDRLGASEGTELLELALLGQADEEAYLDYNQAVEILAAAEILHGLLYGPREGVPERAAQWIESHGQVDVACLKPVCERQLGRVLAEPCELHRAWQENKELYPKWKANVLELQRAMTD